MTTVQRRVLAVVATLGALAACGTLDEMRRVVGPNFHTIGDSSSCASLSNSAYANQSTHVINAPAWNHGINVDSGCGYVPKGTWYLVDTGADTLSPFIHIGSERSGIHIFGAGDSSVIVMDPTVPDTLEFVFLIDGDRVTVESMKLVGTGYGERSGKGGTAVQFGPSADSGVARHLTTVSWGTAGISTYDATRVLIEDNTIIMAVTDTLSMGIWVHGSPANSGAFAGDTVRRNHVRYAAAEGIVVGTHSGVVVEDNILDSCAYGIALIGSHDSNGVLIPGTHADSNRVRDNLIRGAGMFHPGTGIRVTSNASYNVIDSNVVESTYKRDGIHLSSLGTNQANRIEANTVDGVGLDSSGSDIAGIRNGGLNTTIVHNVISNAPVGVANGSTATAIVTFNTLADNSNSFTNQNSNGALSPFCGNSIDGNVAVPCQHVSTVTISGTSEAPPDSNCVFVASAGEGEEQFALRWYVDGTPRQGSGSTFNWAAIAAYSITLVAMDAYGDAANAYHSVGMNQYKENCGEQQRPLPGTPPRVR